MTNQVKRSSLPFTAMQAMKKKTIGICKSLGFRAGAGFLRNMGVPFEEAHELIFGFSPRVTRDGNVIPRSWF